MDRERLTIAVTAAQNGDSDALNLLFNTYYDDVYYFALKTLKDGDLACEITQETFVEIINTLKDLREPAAFVTWMRQITYHQCTRYFKKKKDVLIEEDDGIVVDTLEEDRTEFIPGEGLDQEEFRQTILAMVDTLSEEQRATVLMHYYQEMSVKQIAQIQSVPEGTVKSRLNYARKALRASVEDYERKHDVKLHCAGALPLLLWVLAGTGESAMPLAAAETAAKGICAATGTSVAVSTGGATVANTVTTAVGAGTGLMTKIAALPAVTKIIAGIVATVIAVSSAAVAVGHQAEGKLDSAKPTDTLMTTPTDVVREDRSPAVEVDTGTADNDPGHTVPYSGDVELDLSTVVTGHVPAGCIYSVNSGAILSEGEALPESPNYGDRLSTADHIYEYICDDEQGHGWYVTIVDGSKTEDDPQYSNIIGVPVIGIKAIEPETTPPENTEPEVAPPEDIHPEVTRPVETEPEVTEPDVVEYIQGNGYKRIKNFDSVADKGQGYLYMYGDEVGTFYPAEYVFEVGPTTLTYEMWCSWDVYVQMASDYLFDISDLTLDERYRYYRITECENYTCGFEDHYCYSEESHNKMLEDMVEGCYYCGMSDCISFYSRNEDGFTVKDDHRCPEYDPRRDSSRYCQDCGLPHWCEAEVGELACSSVWIFDMECEKCGQMMYVDQCHHCVKKQEE